MKIKAPGSPLSGGTEPLEPLDPRDLQQTVKSGRFADALSQLETRATSAGASATQAALAEVARDADLSTNEGALTAVRASARYMIASRLDEKHRETLQGEEMIENLSEYVANDPLLKSKLTTILRRLKSA